MKLLLIYNPHAGQGRAKKHLSQVESLFHAKGIETELHLTKRFGHGSEIVRDADLSHYDGIVAAGGDGTVFEVINGYSNNSGDKKPPIGIMPVGTGNAFAIDLNLKTNDIEHAVEIISAAKPRKIDVGKFRTEDQDYYFLNIIGLGFVADVTATARKLKVFGNVAYMFGVLYQTLFLKSHTLDIEIDGKKYNRENIFVEVSNSTYTSNFLMAPNAKIDDGLLDVTLLAKCTRRKLLKSLPTVFTGEHIHLDIVETFKAKKISIKTNVPKVLTPDGELFGSTPLEIECLFQAVEVFAE
jgi:diacylglycerol kinase (ATP)